VTTTTLDDLDPALREVARAWEVSAGEDGAVLTPQPSAASAIGARLGAGPIG
jgi:hypothetical protein